MQVESALQAPASPRAPSVAVVHNRYQMAGGEDEVFLAEADLLERKGHAVLRCTADNRKIGPGNRLQLAMRTIWNTGVHRELKHLFQESGIAVVHFHNTFPLLSPSAHWAARQAGAAVVQTLHNFRLLCSNGLLYRDGHRCEECVGKAVPWPGVVHGCYRGSRAGSAVTASMLAVHRAAHTWRDAVDVYVALSQFSRQKMIEGGLAPERIVVKPNFVAADDEVAAHSGRFALYVGRLSQEKGIGTLLRAWARLPRRFRLLVVGTGADEDAVGRAPDGIEWLGWRDKAEVRQLMREATCLVFPSECYENCPIVLLEALAAGLPVLATRVGSVCEVVKDGEVGRTFEPGDADQLAWLLDWAFDHPRELIDLGARARLEFEAKYTAERSYEGLLEIYQMAQRSAVAMTRSSKGAS